MQKPRNEIPLVIIALVWGGTLNSSAAYFRTAVKGAASGTLNLKKTKNKKVEKFHQIIVNREPEKNLNEEESKI